MVKENKGQTRKINKFKDTAAYLTPCYPVANNFNTNRKCGTSEISNTSGGREKFSATGEN